MLEIARSKPVQQSNIKATKIDLIHGDLSTITFPEQSFDFIYSVGVLGDYAPLSLSPLQLMRNWLKPGGSAFLTIREGPPLSKSWKEYIATFLYPVLPHAVKVYVDVTIGDYMMNRSDCEALLRQVGFSHFEISRQVQRRIYLFATAQK